MYLENIKLNKKRQTRTVRMYGIDVGYFHCECWDCARETEEWKH